MPKTPIDFSKTIIYKIWKDDDFYVGSTTDYASRKSQHKGSCNNKENKDHNLKVYQTIREKGGWCQWEMTPLEEYVDCQSKIQARIREEEWRKKLNAGLNMRKAFGAETKQEWFQNHKEEKKIYDNKYREKNADKIKTYRTQYQQDHKDEINKKRSVKIDCECGLTYTIGNKARHEKSLKHQKYLEKE